MKTFFFSFSFGVLFILFLNWGRAQTPVALAFVLSIRIISVVTKVQSSRETKKNIILYGNIYRHAQSVLVKKSQTTQKATTHGTVHSHRFLLRAVYVINEVCKPIPGQRNLGLTRLTRQLNIAFRKRIIERQSSICDLSSKVIGSFSPRFK